MIPETQDVAALRVGQVVALEQSGPGRYVGYCHGGQVRSRAYGGAVLAHGAAAIGEALGIGHTDRGLHSLHAYFIASVDPRTPMSFAPTPLRVGRNYSVGRVDALQEDRLVFTMTASFKRSDPESFRRHPAVVRGVVGPDESADGFADRGPDSPIAQVLEYRDAGPLATAVPGELARASWFRHKDDLGQDAVAQACGLVYLSDVGLASTAFGLRAGQPRPPGAVLGSIDHALWLHGSARELRTDDWLLVIQRSRVEDDGRTFARGEIWRRDGVLLASVAQEALIRVPPTHRDGCRRPDERHRA